MCPASRKLPAWPSVENVHLSRKVGEGNYNKAYRLEMEDDRRVIAKTSHPNVGPLVLTTASEVATMEFARTVLDLPAPQVLAWSATDQNPVQAEYIIMEGARGSQLHEVWEDLSICKKADIVREFVELEGRCFQSRSKSKETCSQNLQPSSLHTFADWDPCISKIVVAQHASLRS